jgi:tol-pal system protein YbgF
MVVLLGACGGTPSRAETAADVARQRRVSEIHRMRRQAEEAEERRRELEARLALAQAEARDLRYELESRAEAAPRATVVIGERDEGWHEPGVEGTLAVSEDEGVEEVEEAPAGPRPVLRLYGTRPTRPIEEEAALAASALPLPPAPEGVPTSLPVAPLPGLTDVPPPADVPPFVAAPVAPSRPAAPTPDGAVEAYQAALRLVRDRRFDEALPVLDRFLAEHPRHSYAANAAYWRGEVFYAKREYTSAIAAFGRVVQRYPRAAKVADALLKIGLCHQRLGRQQRARAFFARVRREFPNSVAARLASQEDA